MEAFRSRFAAVGRPLDIAEWTRLVMTKSPLSARKLTVDRWHVYDTITKLIYGRPVRMVERGEDVDGLVSEWHKIFRLGGLVATLPWLVHPIISAPLLKDIFMPHKGHTTGSGHIMKMHEKLFNDRLQNPQRAIPGNFFDSFLQSKNTRGEIMSLSEAEHECFILTVGAQDTSAAFISAFLDYIIRNPTVYHALLYEIQHHESLGFISSPVPTYDETCALPYFMACVQETLRLSPSVSMVLPRYAPEGGMMIEGKWVPESVEIAANPYVVHRNTDIFGSDAEAFRPGRWIEREGDAEDKKRIQVMKRYFFAFGYGSRRCLGRNIALFESQKFLVQVRAQWPWKFSTQSYYLQMAWTPKRPGS